MPAAQRTAIVRFKPIDPRLGGDLPAILTVKVCNQGTSESTVRSYFWSLPFIRQNRFVKGVCGGRRGGGWLAFPSLVWFIHKSSSPSCPFIREKHEFGQRFALAPLR
jgi:hypothetical protein